MTPSDDPIDSLVRAYLDRQASAIDPTAGLDRIKQTLDPSRTERPRPRPRPKWGRRLVNRWTLGMAAAAVLLFTLGVFTLPARPVSAESIVRQVKVAQASPLDRCYRVETDFEVDSLDEAHPTVGLPRKTRLWTRGDRFWIESDIGLRHLNWGRDESGGLWLAYTPHRGLRFELTDVPPAIALRCDVLSVKLDTLLGEVLTDFHLETDPKNPAIIRASPRPGRPKILRSALLEVDPATKILKRLELTRTIAGRTITTRFFLEETRDLDDSQYQLEGHLKNPYQINQHELDPQRRRQIMLRLFGIGGRTGEGLPPPRESP
jgi:hypothetical protein